ncbi:hypothetical protein AGR2A_pa60052 [Agrobacterium genomosp. 2 str. CFBP 5494]|uniref:Uncharacterized protein n=1 Tax=Agrobacterium genomosp. 2 str. CFBP 5494 TaxID=1183436 RepID=A0A9W5B773_9HYPH|nr:hypothetical protein AGR2A_pa60052 [Agrobacterium genomosp. 2 str. CFBP 5494]
MIESQKQDVSKVPTFLQVRDLLRAK